ncbi:MAG TPA: hypothetical protein VEP89_18465 [Draconibacterium sp.]|nr:hypothetical protein [Draconibacterium sp.]
MNLKNITLFLSVLLLGNNLLFAETGNSNGKLESLAHAEKIQGKPKIYIEGTRLDFDYLRRNMPYLDFVNDPAVSDIHVIISRRISGSGGRVYSMRFFSDTFENFSEYTVTATTNSSDTEEEEREKIKNALVSGVMPFTNESQIPGELIVEYRPEQEGIDRVEEAEDPWNNWTFRGSFNGGINAEESRKNYDYSVFLRADKVTEAWKFRNSASVSVRTSEITRDDKTYTSERISNNLSSSFVKSLSPRWSVGTFAEYERNNYTNFEYQITLSPAIEYNIFPWDIEDRRVFTIAYHVGGGWAKYYEETIYDKLDEFLWEQSLRVDLQIVETWGEIDAGLRASNYLHDFTKHSIRFDTRLSFRIVRGVSVNFRFDVERIHDQIYLPKGDLSLEDVLLNNVRLPSSFEIGADIGLSIQFGSIYNNIVNNRL